MRGRRPWPRGRRWPAAVALLGLAAALPARAAATTDVQREKVAQCESCHGAEGRSTTVDVPSLAAQPKQFVTTQLVMFREGNRKNAIMNAIAAPLSNAEINELGSYFATQSPSIAGKALAANDAAAARTLTEKLNCVQCHGAELRGQQHIPRLAGQQADYLRIQLIGFKAGTRFDMDGNMTAAAQALTADEIELLANYLSTLR
jgi:cytochrome c553